MKLQFKKLSENAVTPSKAYMYDAGFDLVATSVTTQDNYLEYGTGLAVNIPQGYVGLLFPRSSISKYDLRLCNSVGVIDAGYHGEIRCRFKVEYNGPASVRYNIGNRIAQLVIVPITVVTPELVQEFDTETQRGAGGFGSSGT